MKIESSPFTLGVCYPRAILAPRCLCPGSSGNREFLCGGRGSGYRVSVFGRFSSGRRGWLFWNPVHRKQGGLGRDHLLKSLIRANPEDIVFTDEVSGIRSNFLKVGLERFRKKGTIPWREIRSGD